jgi:DNA phosphorothioation-associated putative methyltransferase
MSVDVQRHRTAMVRHTLSQPLSLAVRHRLVHAGVTVFDYGCGHGDDLRTLVAAGVDANGWDPHFAADQERREADVVNIGFVLNVIENPLERMDALAAAWSLARRVLIVSVMVVGAVPVDGLKPFGDGYLTARGTFQKYFQQTELKALLSQVVDVEPVALAPGIFALFRSPEEEQDFLLERRRGRRASTSAYRSNRPVGSKPTRPNLEDRIAPVIDAMAAFATQRGRMPHPDEVPSELHDLLVRERVSFARALDSTRGGWISDDLLAQAEAQRREDLLVHQALNILNRSRSAARFGPSMVRDIRHHFGSQQQFAELALEYLHGLADQGRTANAALQAGESGLGAIDEDSRLVIDNGRVLELDGILRCYIGCATYLSGEIDQEHVVRLDPLRRMVTLFTLSGKRTPFPETNTSITIDLKRQDVSVRNDHRVLVRKADVFGMAARSRQRSREVERRVREGIDEAKVLVRL